jgi:hypothetical protein
MRPPRDMPWPPHAQSLVHRDRRRGSGEYDPENGDAPAPFCGNIGGVVTPGDQREDEIRFFLHNLDDSGHTGIIFLEAEDDQTEVNIKVMEPGVMS